MKTIGHIPFNGKNLLFIVLHISLICLYVKFKQTLYLEVGEPRIVFWKKWIVSVSSMNEQSLKRDSCKAGENDLMKNFRTSFLPTYNILLLCEINIAGGACRIKI
jgi:hypothetical protein